MKISKDVPTRVFDGELVLLDLAKGDYFRLNEAGARLWAGLGAGKSPREIAEEMVKDLDVDLEVLLADLLAVTDALVARGFVVPV